jgi:hypothetical protein
MWRRSGIKKLCLPTAQLVNCCSAPAAAAAAPALVRLPAAAQLHPTVVGKTAVPVPGRALHLQFMGASLSTHVVPTVQNRKMTTLNPPGQASSQEPSAVQFPLLPPPQSHLLEVLAERPKQHVVERGADAVADRVVGVVVVVVGRPQLGRHKGVPRLPKPRPGGPPSEASSSLLLLASVGRRWRRRVAAGAAAGGALITTTALPPPQERWLRCRGCAKALTAGAARSS